MPGRSYLSGTRAKEGFTSKERDAETGLDYFGARYYYAPLGRWLMPDPLADDYPSWSPYNYVLNNPLGLVDPDGRAPCCLGGSDPYQRSLGQIARGVEGSRRSTTATQLAVAEVGIGFMPGAGEAADAYEVLTGRTWTGQEGSRIGALAALAVPGASSKVIKELGGRITKLLPERAGPVGHLSPGEVIGKTPAEIDERARQLGLEGKGPDPVQGRGSYIDPQTGKQRIGPHDITGRHTHVNTPAGRTERVGPEGKVVDRRSAQAHLPIKANEDDINR